MSEWLGLPVAASEHAPHLDSMNEIVHWLMLALFIGWGAFFVFTLVRFRRRRNPKADYLGLRSHFSTGVEIAVGVAEAVLLIAFAIPAWATRVSDFPPPEQATVVRVVAEQFAWNVHYPGPDGEFGTTDVKLVTPDNPLGLDRKSMHAADDITTINQLNLPVNKPAIVHLTSKDVIHSFGLPNFRVKQDANPGMMTPLWFTPNRPGDYEIACSQLCGLGHFRMRGFVTIQSTDEFQKFLAENAPQ
jgi:cytochrome c oxidase subunit 2